MRASPLPTGRRGGEEFLAFQRRRQGERDAHHWEPLPTSPPPPLPTNGSLPALLLPPQVSIFTYPLILPRDVGQN